MIFLIHFFLFPSEVLGWTSHCHQDPWKQVNTAVVLHSSLYSLSPDQHVSSSTKPSSYSSISHSFGNHVAGSIVCCFNSNPLSMEEQQWQHSNTLSTTSPLIPSRSSFARGKGRTKWFLKSLLILWINREKVLCIGCPWNHLQCPHNQKKHLKKLISPFHCFCPDKSHLSVHHYFSWIKATW